MNFETLRIDVSEGIANIVLNRPESQNAINLLMTKELMEVAIFCDEDPSVRVVVLTGSGKIFSVGGDIREFVAAGSNLASLTKEMTVFLHAAVSRFARMDAPLIAAVNGVAAGGGFGLCCCADIVLAADSARFCTAYTRSGLAADTSTTYFLPRVVGLRRASELLITNRTLTAQEAEGYGLVTEVVLEGELADRSQELASELAKGATKAYGFVKKLLGTSFSETLETQMEYESRAIADSCRTEDVAEGIRAFLAKRTPDYQGR